VERRSGEGFAVGPSSIHPNSIRRSATLALIPIAHYTRSGSMPITTLTTSPLCSCADGLRSHHLLSDVGQGLPVRPFIPEATVLVRDPAQSVERLGVLLQIRNAFGSERKLFSQRPFRATRPRLLDRRAPSLPVISERGACGRNVSQ
jgi:hypothetical protein